MRQRTQLKKNYSLTFQERKIVQEVLTEDFLEVSKLKEDLLELINKKERRVCLRLFGEPFIQESPIELECVIDRYIRVIRTKITKRIKKQKELEDLLYFSQPVKILSTDQVYIRQLIIVSRLLDEYNLLLKKKLNPCKKQIKCRVIELGVVADNAIKTIATKLSAAKRKKKQLHDLLYPIMMHAV